MAEKPKCSQCHERDVFSKGLCSGCYGKNWRLARKAERDAAIAEQCPPKQLTSGVAGSELAVIEGEIVHDDPPDPHLIALNPAQMEAARGDMKVWLEQKLTVIERDIVEANAALNEARKNGWATGAFVSARNRAIDDEAFYNKILMAVEAGYTPIPDFPISVFAIRRAAEDKAEKHTWTGRVNKGDVWLSRPADADCAPAGAGEYRNPTPQIWTWYGFERTDSEGRKYTPYTIERTGQPIGPITFPASAARSAVMAATEKAMGEKVFDQIGVCHPIAEDRGARRIRANAGKAGDPLIIGQVVRKALGGRRKVVSFIIAWHLNLNDL